AQACDRAGRAPYGRLPCRSPAGDRLRVAARLVGLLGTGPGGGAGLVASLADLAAAVAELRQAQQHAAQAAAARTATEHLHDALTRTRPAAVRRRQRDASMSPSGRPAAGEFAARPVIPVTASGRHEQTARRSGQRHRPSPRRRAGPAP
ncbi:MAG: hypothetical protein ACRDNZ_15080, partial [Streptosporangiaceae bacterium]